MAPRFQLSHRQLERLISGRSLRLAIPIDNEAMGDNAEGLAQWFRGRLANLPSEAAISTPELRSLPAHLRNRGGDLGSLQSIVGELVDREHIAGQPVYFVRCAIATIGRGPSSPTRWPAGVILWE